VGTRLVKPEATGITRRAFVYASLLLVGIGRRIRAQAADYTRYQPLVRPVQVPLEDLATPSKAFPFVADGMTLPSAAEPNQPVRFNGMVVRTSKGDNSAGRFKAVCLKCPHEGCDVDFIADPSRVPGEVTDAIGHVSEALYICPCHNSTFKIDDGSKLFGPAPRGLYQFHVTGVNATAVEIGEVEEDALLFA
jgi:Rieske Fe-S protein